MPSEFSKSSLNRLVLLPEKKISNSCPVFVIEFIAKSLGIRYNYESLDWKKDEIKIKTLTDSILLTLEEEDMVIHNIETHLRDIALFVNPESSVQWKKRTILMDSFWSIHNFTPKIPLKENEVFGYKTEATPYAIDPMMTYLIAYHYGIPMNRDTQLESIQREIINYSVQLTPLRINIITKLTRMSRRGLIDIKNKFLPESPTDTSNNFPCILYPLTNSEAIERCAKDYRWDISLSRDPISEYIELDRVANDKYCPIDDEWRKVFDVNRQYFHLDFRYIKKFDHLYTENIKKGLIYRNGGSEKSDYLTFGIHPLYPGSTTIDTLRTCINNDPVSYDSIDRYRNLISSPDFIISREELFDLWKFNDCFVAPNDPSKELSDYH